MHELPTMEEIDRLREKYGEHSDEFTAATLGPDYVRRMKEIRAETDQGNKYCERCGGVLPASLIWGNPRRCECEALFSRARKAIAAVDPAEEMTFDAMDSPHPTVKDTAAKLREIVDGERQGGVFMFGLPGRGKTFLSMATARALLDRGKLAGVYNLAGLVGRIQDTYGYDDSAESRVKIVREVCSCDVVILDDIGKEHQSANVESIVYELIDGMYNARVTLIASSNLPGKDFVARYDGAVLSRLGGMCEKVVIRGEDRRAAKWEW